MAMAVVLKTEQAGESMLMVIQVCIMLSYHSSSSRIVRITCGEKQMMKRAVRNIA